MAIILAIEPDRKQAAHLSAVVRHRVGAELILADTTEGALNAIGSRVPDLVLVPALISPQDDAALAAALRVIAAAAHVRILTTPVFSNGTRRGEDGGGLLSRFKRGRPAPATDGCDPAVFAEQISDYLREAAEEQAERAELEAEPDVNQPFAEEPVVVAPAPAPIQGEPEDAREPKVSALSELEDARESTRPALDELEDVPSKRPVVVEREMFASFSHKPEFVEVT